MHQLTVDTVSCGTMLLRIVCSALRFTSPKLSLVIAVLPVNADAVPQLYWLLSAPSAAS